jgi:putative transposase
MLNTIRKVHPPAFKTKVALEAIKETKTMAEISSLYEVHTTQIKRWKQKAIESLESCFTEANIQKEKDEQELIQTLYQEIGRLKIELDWLKKKMGLFDQR